MSHLKLNLYEHLYKLLDDKINSVKKGLNNAIESRNNETKSSAGDKHETARAMSQIEIENIQIQLSKLIDQRAELEKIEKRKFFEEVSAGNIVITNQGNYFISVGLGKIELEDEEYYAISLASPLGQILYNKKVKDEFTFHERKFIIKKIY